LEEDGEDVTGFIFTIEGALVAVDFFVSVLEENFEVVVVLLGEDFGHDFVDFDIFEVFFRVVEDGAGLGVDHGDAAQFVFGEGQGDQSDFGVEREVLNFFVLFEFRPEFIEVVVDFPGLDLVGFDGSEVHAVEFEDLEGGEGFVGESVFEDFLDFVSEGEDLGGDGGEFVEIDFFLIKE